MAITIPEIGEVFGMDEITLALFTEMLSFTDQQVLSELLASTEIDRQVLEKSARAASLELLMLAILIQQQKTIQFLVSRLDYYDEKLYQKRVKM